MPVMGANISYSVTGVPDKDGGYDRIHVFVAGNYNEEKKAAIIADILNWQKNEAKLYPIKGIHFIKDMPKTSIGKVQRVKLRENILSGEATTLVQNEGDLLNWKYVMR